VRPTLALIAALLLGGCLGPEPVDLTLRADAGQDRFYIALVVDARGEVERANAWWAEAGQSFNTSAYRSAPGVRAAVVRNDLALAHDLRVLTDGERYVVLWDSASGGATTRPGDEYEFYVLEDATGSTVASVRLRIAR